MVMKNCLLKSVFIITLAVACLSAACAADNEQVRDRRFFGQQPQTDIALLEKGFHLVYMDVAGLYGLPKAVEHFNAFYKYLTKEQGLAKKPALEGMSRGGLIVYNWAAQNPDKVACIYADAPVCDFECWPGGKGHAARIVKFLTN